MVAPPAPVFPPLATIDVTGAFDPPSLWLHDALSRQPALTPFSAVPTTRPPHAAISATHAAKTTHGALLLIH
jgi:hypothetical protein